MTFLPESFDDHILQVAFKLSLEDGDIRWKRVVNNEVTIFDKEPHTSWWDRFSNRFMSYLPVESEL